MTIDAPVFPAEPDLRTGRLTITPSADSHAEYSVSVQMRTPHDHRRPRIPSRARPPYGKTHHHSLGRLARGVFRLRTDEDTS